MNPFKEMVKPLTWGSHGSSLSHICAKLPVKPLPAARSLTATPFGAGRGTGFWQGPAVQAALTVGPADDEYEREADRVADQVMRMPEPGAQRSCRSCHEEETVQRAPLAARITPLVERQTAPEEEEELQAKPLAGQFQRAGANGGPAGQELEQSLAQARGSGSPLDEKVRGRMENAFGVDFSGVRIHSDARADGLSRSIQARAFTRGQDIFLRLGEYQPASARGQRLLAHELTHVVQQNGGAVQSAHMQATGQVKPTMKIKDRFLVNDDKGLAQKADVIEAKALENASQFRGDQEGLKWLQSPFAPAQHKRREQEEFHKAPAAVSPTKWIVQRAWVATNNGNLIKHDDANERLNGLVKDISRIPIRSKTIVPKTGSTHIRIDMQGSVLRGDKLYANIQFQVGEDSVAGVICPFDLDLETVKNGLRQALINSDVFQWVPEESEPPRSPHFDWLFEEAKSANMDLGIFQDVFDEAIVELTTSQVTLYTSDHQYEEDDVADALEEVSLEMCLAQYTPDLEENDKFKKENWKRSFKIFAREYIKQELMSKLPLQKDIEFG